VCPQEYLAYLKAAEPLLAPGARIVADNVGCGTPSGLLKNGSITQDACVRERVDLVGSRGRWKRPSASNSPHDHMIWRVDLVGSHGRWRGPCLQTTRCDQVCCAVANANTPADGGGGECGRVFEGATADYLSYVRTSGNYASRRVDCQFGYRPEVADAMEVSIFQPQR
jgi:hypothetical protein